MLGSEALMLDDSFSEHHHEQEQTIESLEDHVPISTIQKSKTMALSNCPPSRLKKPIDSSFETSVFRQEIIRTMGNISNLQLLATATNQSLFRTRHNQLMKYCKFVVETKQPTQPPEIDQKALLVNLSEPISRITLPGSASNQMNEDEEDDDDEYWIDYEEDEDEEFEDEDQQDD